MKPGKEKGGARFAAFALAWLIGGVPGSAGATILTFDQTRDSGTGAVVPTASPSTLPDDYGDFAAGPFVAVPGGTFVYQQGGEGFTPNVAVDVFGGGASPTNSQVRLWRFEYGDLVDVAFTLQTAGSLNILLTADPGVDVLLYGFDLAGYPLMDYIIDAVEVLSGTTMLFSQADVLVEGDFSGPGRTAFEFASPLAGSELLIRIDYANLPDTRQDNIAIDNIRFGQNPPGVPEPGSFLLLASALAALGLRRQPRP